MQRIVVLCLFATLPWFARVSLRADDATSESQSAARRLLLGGHYAEASEQYQKLKDQAPIEAAIGLSRAQMSLGKTAAALETLRRAIGKAPEEAGLQAELAIGLFQRGDYEAARQAVGAALKLDEDQALARWIQAELLRTSGKLEEASAAYKWLIDLHGRKENMADPDALRYMGLAAAEYARWNRVSEQFAALVNDWYPTILRRDEHLWWAEYEIGRLFLEKYNQREATKAFEAALKLNPNAAEVYAALAELALQNYNLDTARRSLERALEINPQLPRALQLKADLHASNFEIPQAIAVLREAEKLNPRDEETLARLAAALILDQGLPAEMEGSELGKIVKRVDTQNPHAGVFYYTLGNQLSERRKFSDAERFYRQALERMPQLIGPRGQLGLLYMRLGQEPQAKQLLDEAFEIDPFNVRVKNMLEVLDVLSGYATIETEHFIIKFDRGHDEILARYAAKYLEDEAYPTLCRQFNFHPEGKTLFEIFNRAKNTNGHGWFSARMVGLPYIGTVGACAGKMVALASPGSLEQPYNWARVLKHEFVHVLNLQQTNFNIPHWYTEALAVLNEDFPRPETWNNLLAARVPKGEVFNLDDINLGFIRPKSSNDWQMAYCQAELYAEYLLKTYGDDALAKMLDAYAKNMRTPAALKHCFGVEKDDFERGYRQYLEAIVKNLAPAARVESEQTFAQLVRAAADKPDDPEILAQLALAYLGRESYAKARHRAEAALKLKPRQPLAGYVLARLYLEFGEGRKAYEILQECLDEQAPHSKVLELLAAMKLRLKDAAGAERLFLLGRKANPQESKWLKALRKLYFKTDQTDKLTPLLKEIAENDADDFESRKALAQISLNAGDWPAARLWANQANEINVMDAEIHRVLGEALLGEKQPEEAAEEFEVAIRLNGKDPEVRLALAKAFRAAKQDERAKTALEDLLRRWPDHAEAKKLMKELE